MGTGSSDVGTGAPTWGQGAPTWGTGSSDSWGRGAPTWGQGAPTWGQELRRGDGKLRKYNLGQASKGDRMQYVEEKEFTLRLEIRCEFPDDYQGEEDGYLWAGEIEPITAEIVKAAVAIVESRRGWSVRPSNRGRSSLEEVTLVVQREPSSG